MIGVALIRPDLYAITVQVGEAAVLEGTSIKLIPQINGAIEPGGIAALLTDIILLGAGIAPPGLVLGETA